MFAGSYALPAPTMTPLVYAADVATGQRVPRAAGVAAPVRGVAMRAPSPASSVTARASSDDASGQSIVERSGTSYYKVIDGVRYDRKVLDDCAAYEKNDGAIDLAEAKAILGDLLDGPVRKVEREGEAVSSVTNVELDTAQYAFDNFTWTKEAKEWFFEKLTSRNW